MLNADLETYFVFDDNEDREYILKNDFHPDADDASRGGWACRCEPEVFVVTVRGGCDLCWYYEITNMGTTDYPKTLFAVCGLGNRGGTEQLFKQRGQLQQTTEHLLRLVYGFLRRSGAMDSGWLFRVRLI